MKSYIEVVVEEQKRMTPKDGFNVVVFDEYGRPGEMLELIAHVDTEKEANAIKQSLKGETVYIYSPDGTKKTT
jgi:hypothetical protein